VQKKKDKNTDENVTAFSSSTFPSSASVYFLNTVVSLVLKINTAPVQA